LNIVNSAFYLYGILFEFSILLVYLPTPGVENPGTFNNSKPYNEIYVRQTIHGV